MKECIEKLAKLLDKVKVPYTRRVLFDGEQIRIGALCDAICHRFSHGEEQDLLEIQGALTEAEYEEEPKLFLNSKSYKIDDDKLQVTIFYQDKEEWKLCCKGEGFSDAVSFEYAPNEVILNIKNLEFDSDFAKSHDITDRWDRWLRLKVLFKGTTTFIDGKHPIDILCNNCEVLYQENDSLVLGALYDENGEKMQLIIEDDDNYKEMAALLGESK